MRDLDGEALAVSHWTRIEFASLIAREVRMGGLPPAAAKKADARFQVMADDSFLVILPTPEDFALAAQYLRRFETGLRAGDALHLAIGANHGAEKILTLDKTFVRAGEILGLPVSEGL